MRTVAAARRGPAPRERLEVRGRRPAGRRRPGGRRPPSAVPSRVAAEELEHRGRVGRGSCIAAIRVCVLAAGVQDQFRDRERPRRRPGPVRVVARQVPGEPQEHLAGTVDHVGEDAAAARGDGSRRRSSRSTRGMLPPSPVRTAGHVCRVGSARRGSSRPGNAASTRRGRTETGPNRRPRRRPSRGRRPPDAGPRTGDRRELPPTRGGVGEDSCKDIMGASPQRIAGGCPARPTWHRSGRRGFGRVIVETIRSPRFRRGQLTTISGNRRRSRGYRRPAELTARALGGRRPGPGRIGRD